MNRSIYRRLGQNFRFPFQLKFSKGVKDLFSSVWESPWFRFTVLILIIIQISSLIAHWSEKALKKDLEWEKAPDRLPDLVDLAIQTQNQEAKVNQAMKDFDHLIPSQAAQPMKGNEPSQSSLRASIQELYRFLLYLKRVLSETYSKNISQKS